MASTKVKAIVIESKDYKEKDKLVSLYSLEQGKVRAVFRGVRGEKAKMKAAKEIFSFGEFFIENTKGNNIVSQADIIESFHPLSQNLDKYYEACSIIDVIKKLGTEESDPALFVEVIKALKCLCYEDVKPHYVLNKFLLNVFSGAGYPINTEKCSSCKSVITGTKFFNYEYGEIVCGACRTYTCEPLSPVAASALKIMSATPYEKLPTLRLATGAERELLELLLKNFEARFNEKIFCQLF